MEPGCATNFDAQLAGRIARQVSGQGAGPGCRAGLRGGRFSSSRLASTRSLDNDVEAAVRVARGEPQAQPAPTGVAVAQFVTEPLARMAPAAFNGEARLVPSPATAWTRLLLARGHVVHRDGIERLGGFAFRHRSRRALNWPGWPAGQ